MWTNAEADTRRRDRMQEAERRRTAAAGRTAGTRRALAGLRLLEEGRA
jgi:hypothetical protein